MTRDYVMVPCILCGRERAILTKPNIHVWAAWRRLCKACSIQTTRGNITSSHQHEVDEVAVQRLISGQPPAHTTRAERQLAVRQLLTHRMTNRAIAERLHVTQRTVERLRARAAS